MLGVKSGSMRLGLDGESVILANRRKTLSTSYDSFDIPQVIRHKLAELKIQVDMFRIKGHQDKNGRNLEDLHYDSQQLNIMSDGLAKAYWNETKHRQDIFNSRRISHVGCHLTCNNTHFTRVYEGLMYDLVYGINKSIGYCDERTPQEYCSYKDINLDAIRKAMEGLKLGQKYW